MSFISPMLASPMPTDLQIPFDKFVVEEKLDGHRLIVRIGGSGIQNDLFMTGSPVRAWSRDGLSRVLPRHITDSLSQFPVCVLDGELLVPGKRSYGVTELSNAGDLKFVAFDILEMLNITVCDLAYHHRRAYLETMFNHESLQGLPGVGLAWSKSVENFEDIRETCREVWARDGEGLILKDRNSLYYPGKRPKNVWIKIKQLQSAVLTITGYEYGLLGPYAKVKLVDLEGNQIAVKVRNTELRNRITANPNSFIGRKLRVEFQERTPDSSYRHPRWDSLVEEDE
jgi:ATP-dependent DNA ligase